VRRNQKDPTRSRVPARTAHHVSFAATVSLVFLLAFPALAVLRLAQSIDCRFILGYLSVISISTYVAYRSDKKRAERGEWRIPESTLHFLEQAGGWPAAFLAQRLLRHKISKSSYQVVFWTTVAIHEYLAFDFLQGWPNTKKILMLIRSQL
jgi:uncharacterized membrane protein YsdA (DUF1294 family)